MMDRAIQLSALWPGARYHPCADGVFGCGKHSHCDDDEGLIARFSLHHLGAGY
jgi:hypothetical protein